ncbi:MAG: hypothetical protein AAGI15_18195, partial [Pseudomonadota bacterium]
MIEPERRRSESRGCRAALLALLMPLTLLSGAACTSTPPAAPTTPAPVADQELADRLSAPSPIAAGDSYWIEELTWMEVRDAIA